MERVYGDALSVIDVVVSSEDGTIIIPKAMREKLGVTSGTRFAVLAEKDTLIFKKIKGPSKKEFEKLAEKGARIAKENELKEEDIEEIIHKHRGVTVA
jgi:AbrB family looped-hinge helix DNA binding protein